jgi:hypothetical protein
MTFERVSPYMMLSKSKKYSTTDKIRITNTVVCSFHLYKKNASVGLGMPATIPLPSSAPFSLSGKTIEPFRLAWHASNRLWLNV